ncbi:MAG: DUF4256 domain-containing protein [Bacteroidota bacterium]|nr:DUF4256 domain-containing protein [Bacteroidota bacterium]MDX5404570.1 DUF4256 domain-containing protein [Bacteroidota bacterium]
MSKAIDLSTAEKEALIKKLKVRFEKNMHRHADLTWNEVIDRLNVHPNKWSSLYQMEETGGEPDVVGRVTGSGAIRFVDCSKESPKGRRSLCYDRDALESRKKFKPENSALDLAREMGISLLNEEQYRNLQELEEFDLKTSSWLDTPDRIRNLGGALFGDRRFDTVFIYHNGAESYYAARGFRGQLEI